MIRRSQLDLRKFVAPEFICGYGALQLAGRCARNFGVKRVLLVTDPGVRAAGWAEAVGESLTEAGISFSVFDSVSVNPRSTQVMAGMEAYRSEECNGLVAVGGGSPMDCAKGIGIASSNMRDILAFEGVDRVPVPAPPLICIPTTAGSSADVSQFAIITDEARKRKVAIISKTLVPDISLLDPEPLTTMPLELTLDTGMDALSHAVESYVSNASSPMTDMHALEAIRLIRDALPAVMERPDDLDLRFSTLLASLYAGLAFSNASLGAVHAMAHSIGGACDLAHGRCNALLLEHVIAANYEAAPDRYDRIGEIFCPVQDGRTSPAESIAAFRRSLGITGTLAAVGVRKDAIGTLARRAYADPCMVTNPRRLTCEDIERIYERAL
ncbi:iron-containing alcohol dehydrogenase [Methanoculleus sp. Wushi-C6]|uniref:Iron-containing alcohol dehydrogenase n=1 Tax=Methanoculleus caldifontis TaxID=2651577 RepID=A0ABU3X1S6_9EURY|nr:alcohol dehydrogenase-like regulatory protein ErcA [Methanoculleus sp. Wushi-C6]MDV2482014.1 iron-containing alcohol dehydrogenase [Methanoculleus sp. Wushi-C6]